MLINLMAVVILWMTRHIRPPLKVTLISMTLSDLLFTTFAAFWRPTFPCWPALYFITSTILVSYFCTAAIALYNHIAVFHPFRCKEIFTLRRSIVAAASCWLGGLLLSLACLDVHIPAEPTCFAASNMPRYGLVTVSSVCLICSCFIIVANVRVLFNIRRRSPITGRDGAPADATLQGNRDTPKASNVKLWSTRTSCSIPIPSSTSSMSKNYRADIKPPVTCQNVIALERNRIAQPGASEETNTRDRNHLQVPRTHWMSHNCKYTSQAYIEANASLEISVQNDENLIRSSKKPLKVITHINNAFLLSLDPIANAIYFHKVTEEDEKPDIQIEKDITTHTDAIVSLPTRQVPETVSRKEILLDRVSNLEESQTNMNVERTASLHKLERLSTEYPDICEPRSFSDSHDTTRDLSTIELEHSDFFNSMPPPSSRATETSTPGSLHIKVNDIEPQETVVAKAHPKHFVDSLQYVLPNKSPLCCLRWIRGRLGRRSFQLHS